METYGHCPLRFKVPEHDNKSIYHIRNLGKCSLVCTKMHDAL